MTLMVFVAGAGSAVSHEALCVIGSRRAEYSCESTANAGN